jgi:hypothetical protein
MRLKKWEPSRVTGAYALKKYNTYKCSRHIKGVQVGSGPVGPVIVIHSPTQMPK